MGNTVGLPALPRGNSMTVKLNLTRYGGTQPVDITGFVFAFIASRFLDGKTPPPVYIEWNLHTDPQQGATEFLIPDYLTRTLSPGDYSWNVTARDPSGNVETYAAGTWPIVPVPGLMGIGSSSSGGGGGGNGGGGNGGGGGAGLPDAPIDGNLYGRQDAAWAIVPTVAGPPGPTGPPGPLGPVGPAGPGVNTYDISLFASGKVLASAMLMRFVFDRPVNFTVNLSGSLANAGTAPTNQTIFTIAKNGTSIGTLSFAAGALNGIFSILVAPNFIVGDILSIVAPDTQDATLANLSVTLNGFRG
jgi:hypothetical protein